MKAVIMAGGEGKRLRPLTCCNPKPMVPVVNKPVMQHIVELLKKNSILDIGVTLNYLPGSIVDYFGDGSAYGTKMKYFYEKKPLGNAGGIKNAEKFIDDTFIAISGDALTDLDILKALHQHKKNNAMVTIILKKVDIPLEFGVVLTEDDGRIVKFIEKPSWGEVFNDNVNTGIYIMEPEILEFIKKDQVFDFSRNLFPLLLEKKIPVYGYVTDDYWCDIGDYKGYFKANFDALDGLVKLNIPGKEIRKKLWVGEETIILDDTQITTPCIIGSNCVINGSIQDGHCIIGDNCHIGERSILKKSILWNNCVVSKNVHLRGAILCNKTRLKDNSSVYENAIIGDETIIGEGAIIKPDIKLWPCKVVEEGAMISSDIIWGSKLSQSLFGSKGVTGYINEDISPENASRIGAAFGFVVKNKKCLGVSCENKVSSMMFKRAIISGLQSTGIEVYDFDSLLLPVMRSAVRAYNLDGGIHIMSSSFNSSRILISFIDQKGNNINRETEKKVENTYYKEEYLRCSEDSIKEPVLINGYESFYKRQILSNIGTSSFKYKVVLNSISEQTTIIFQEILLSIGCSVEIINPKLGLNVDFKYMSSYVVKNGFDFGVIVEETAEKLSMIDNKGRIITEDILVALLAGITLRKTNGCTLFVPTTASNVIDNLATKFNGNVIRIKSSGYNVEESKDSFIVQSDAITSLVKIIDYMIGNKMNLSDVLDMIPEFYIKKREVDCPWNEKGRVIREIIRDNKGKSIDISEGVKIKNDNGWVHVLADSDRPVCRIISESSSEEFAEELTDIYEKRIREFVRGETSQ